MRSAVKRAFEAIGTQWQIDADLSDAEYQLILETIESYDQTYSRFRNNSLVTQMSKRAGDYRLPSHGNNLLSFYESMYEATNGHVNPLIGQLLSDAGYDASYSLQPKKLSAVPNWDEVLERSDDILTVKQPALLDFGAAGKGQLVDIVATQIHAFGQQSFCVNAGGDIYVAGKQRTIGLEHPHDPSQVIGTATIAEKSICGSAPNRRAWAEYHHIMNPETLQSTQDIDAVWVIAAQAMIADGLTTCLYFVAPEQLESLASFEYGIVFADGSVRYSKNFPGTFF